MKERLYDLIFICRPDTPEAELDKVIAALEHSAAEKGGKVEKVEKWGTRKLAYRVRKQREGQYVCLQLRGSQGEMVKELERRLKVSDPVIKHLTVRLDEEVKRQKKLALKRERRAARRGRRSSAPAAAAGEQAVAG